MPVKMCGNGRSDPHSERVECADMAHPSKGVQKRPSAAICASVSNMTRREAFGAFLGLGAMQLPAPVPITNPRPPVCPFDGGLLDELGQVVVGVNLPDAFSRISIDPIHALAKCQTCGLVSIIRQGAQ